jgi:hypothetical protein
MLRRERADVRPRAVLLLGWDGSRDEAFDLWRDLGAVAIDDPREANDAPLIVGVTLFYWPTGKEEEGERTFIAVGPDRSEPDPFPVGTVAMSLHDGPGSAASTIRESPVLSFRR